MRTWRVGTISMGVALILLGVILFLSQIQGIQTVKPFLTWWPLILVVLGIEIIAYIVLSKQESPVIKYDFLSIIFVGVIGTMGIAFFLFMSIGVLQEFQAALGEERRTLNLPAMEQPLDSQVNKVIVDTGGQQVDVETSAVQEVHLFGTYTAVIREDSEAPIRLPDDYLIKKQVGETLYIMMKEPPRRTGPFGRYSYLEATVVVPEQIEVEVRE